MNKTKYHAVGLFVLLIFISLCSINKLVAQDSLSYRLAINTRSPKMKVWGYAHHLSADTLWLAPNYGPLSNGPALIPYEATEIYTLDLPIGKKKKNSFGAGLLIGSLSGLIVGAITQPECNSNQPFGNLCALSGTGHTLGSTLIGGVGGGLIGLFIRREKVTFNSIPIIGDPNRLQAQQEALAKLNPWLNE